MRSPSRRPTSVGSRSADPRFQSSPFTLGVASGDPMPDGVVLWTRLAPDPLNGGGMTPERVTVNWRVAEDDGMRNVVRRGAIDASPDYAHAVHVEVSGLRPDRPYWYQFDAGGSESVVGRTRTMPADNVVPQRMRFAFVSCSHFEMGYFTPLGHLADEDVSLAFHLGDYIYESAGRNGGVRRHVGGETRTLDEYRTRYAQYKTDVDLQRVHASMPFAVTWDNHEVDNDYAGVFSEEPMPMDMFLLRRAAAYQAYYEHMPLRASARPRAGAVHLYRRLQYGRLASFFVLDTRQYRSDQPCGAGPICAGSVDPATAMLGAEQERWFLNGIRQSGARWTVVPQQIMMAKVDFAPGAEERYFTDHWNGYDAARSRILAAVCGAAIAQCDRPDGRPSQQLGQRSEARFRGSEIANGRDRAGRHVDQFRRRRFRPPRQHEAGCSPRIRASGSTTASAATSPAS